MIVSASAREGAMSRASAALAAVTGRPRPPRLLNRPRPLRPSELSRRSRLLCPLRPLQARRPLAGQTILVTRHLGNSAKRSARSKPWGLAPCMCRLCASCRWTRSCRRQSMRRAASRRSSSAPMRCVAALARCNDAGIRCPAVMRSARPHSAPLAERGVDALAPTDGDGAAALLRRPEIRPRR